MNLHLHLFDLDLAEYGPLARAAEAAGWSGLWISDHMATPTSYHTPYPYEAPGGQPYLPSARFPDVWAVLAHVAAVTTTLRVGPGVYILPLRKAIPTARAAATVQGLSDGRLLFGVGTGWMAEEFEAVGEPFDHRGARTDEILDAMAALWTGQPASFSGRHVRFAEVQLPPAVEVPIPIVVGGTSPAALRRAAGRGDGWYGMPCPLDEAVAVRAAVEAERARAGRVERPFTYYLRPDGPLDPEVLARYRHAGFTDLVATSGALGVPRSASAGERLAAVAEAGERLGLHRPG